MKRLIVTKKQLNEYVQRKKAEKVYYDIVTDIYQNKKNLTESVSIDKSNQSVIDNYRRKGFINNKVFEMLKRSKLIDNDYKII